MNIYRIKIVMPDGSRGTCQGNFTDGFEAVMQVMADFPGAKAISAIFLAKGGAA